MTRTAKNHRDQPKMIAKLLNDALAKDDTVAFVKAIGDLIRAEGMTFAGTMMPNIDRVIRTLAGSN